jgi:hypothetical protein
MKRGLLVILVLLFALPLVSAVPTFNLFNGNVLCDGDVQTGYSVYTNVYNGTDVFNETGSVSSSGEYALVVGANDGYNISFYVDNVIITTVLYNESSWVRNQDLSLAGSHALCDDGDTGGGNTGGDDDDDDDDNGGGADPRPYCGDGTCDTDESCSGCAEDCGQCPPPADDWELSGPTVDVPQEGVIEVVSVGGDYDLLIEGTSSPFSIWDVSSESAKIDIDGVTYVIPYEATVEIGVGDYSVLVSYLATNDGKAKIAFNNAGIRAISAFPGAVVVYWVLGIIIVGVGIFFLLRWYKNRKPGVGKSKVEDEKSKTPVKTLSLKPSKEKKKVVNKKDRNLLSGPEE